MSLHQQNSQRSRFNPYFQSTGNAANGSNLENNQVADLGRNIVKERGGHNSNRAASGNLYENSFIHKTYQNVRSFGKDLSNYQQFNEAKQAYGDLNTNKTIVPMQKNQVLRVKSSIGTNQIGTGNYQQNKKMGAENPSSFIGQDQIAQQIPSKFIRTKDRPTGNSQEPRPTNISTRSARGEIRNPQDDANPSNQQLIGTNSFQQQMLMTTSNLQLQQYTHQHSNPADDYQLQFPISTKNISRLNCNNNEDVIMSNATSSSQPTKQLSEKENRLQTFWKVEVPQFSQELSEVDRNDINNPQCIADCAQDVYIHMLNTERQNIPGHTYMAEQNDINEKMRAILIDWLIEVHFKFKLLPETLFLTVNLIDRYLEKTSIHRTKLQLVGVTSMLIASKYEEIYAPEVRDFVYITDKAYTKEDILQMEYAILTTLDFEICSPSAYRFLERFTKVGQVTPKQFSLAQYLIELPLIEYRMLKYTPSNVAASALYLSLKIIPRQTDDGCNLLPSWDDQLAAHSNYKEKQLRECAKDLCILLQGIEKCSLQAIRKKFSQPQHNEVALIRLEQ